MGHKIMAEFLQSSIFQSFICFIRDNHTAQLMQERVIFVDDDLICVFIEATHQKRNRILPRLWDECRYDLDDFC